MPPVERRTKCSIHKIHTKTNEYCITPLSDHLNQTLKSQSGKVSEYRIHALYSIMADDKDPFKELMDLARLKGQLENVRQRIESEVPQSGSVMSAPLIKGLLAGYIVAKLRSAAVLGVLLGTCTGIYAAQNYKVPNIEETIKGYFSSKKNR